MADGQHLLQSRTVHTLLGLSEAVILALVGLMVVGGTLGWVFVAVAPVNALVTMYILGTATSQRTESDTGTGGGFSGE